jgi:purine-binding chemotaxis protein CheW
MQPDQTYCTFRLAGQLFGLPVEGVQEILREQPLTPTPLAADSIRGLMNLRGLIVLAIDLRRRLALPPRGPTEQCKNVVVHTDRGLVALQVDEVGDVISVDTHTRDEIPQYVSEQARAKISCAYKLPQELLLVLNSEAAWTI